MNAIETYLQSYQDYFWQYEDSGVIIAIPNGRTIGYSSLILSEIIPALAPQGLPRFGSLLIAMAATNAHGEDALNSIFRIALKYVHKCPEVEKGIWFAKLLAQLPAEYKKGALRIELLRGIFYLAHNSIGKRDSNLIKQALEGKFNLKAFPTITQKKLLHPGQIIVDFNVLALIGKQLPDINAIINRIANLPPVGEALSEIDFLPEKEVAPESLIDSLLEDQRTFHVGALVSRLISGLHIPFHSNLPSQQPLGGVADITNKGNFDKLLISEFAFDDAILMSRLANNEALYHHREVPPADHDFQRVILIDTTLKNWGTIRTIAFATMLAITEHPKNQSPCKVYLIGKSYTPAEWNSIDLVVQAMQYLDPTMDPGVGLFDLFEAEEMKKHEVFFIGTAESFTQPKMIAFQSEYGQLIDHWIHPDEDGKIALYKNPKRGKRLIQELKLPLNELWNQKRPLKSPILSTQEVDYPILFPAFRRKTTWWGTDFTYAVTKEKSVVRFFGDRQTPSRKGWEMISSHFSGSNRMLAVMTLEDLSAIALVAQPSSQFALIHLTTNEVIPIQKPSKLYYANKYEVVNDHFICSSSVSNTRINLDGSVVSTPKKFEIKPKEKEQPRYLPEMQVYKNLDAICLTSKNQLRFGKHDLAIKQNCLILAHQNGVKTIPTFHAEKLRTGLFQFKDGSQIKHDRNGMLTLISSNRDLPTIYIPCVVNNVLAMATDHVFAGNEYYRMEEKHELHLRTSAVGNLNLIKDVKEILGYQLKDSKRWVDNQVIPSTDQKALLALRDQWSQAGVESVYYHRGITQESISANIFYQRYIQAFINQIISHEP